MNLHLYAGPSQSVEHLHIKGWHGAVVEHLYIVLLGVFIGDFHCFWVYILGFKNWACVKGMTNVRRLYIKGWHGAVVEHLSTHCKPHICCGRHRQCPWRKFCQMENFQIERENH